MLSAGCHSAANLRYRPTMEDRHYWEIDDTRAYFGVFDGHAGSGCASWCARNVHVYLDRNLSVCEEDRCLESTIQSTFKECDQEVCKVETSGATGSVVYIDLNKHEPGRRMYCANVGDSHVVLSKRGRAHRLSAEHRTSNIQETRRILAGGAKVRNGRVGGVLSVTRAFGDPALKKSLVIADPFVMHKTIEHDDDMVIVASDGLWDVCSPQAAVELISNIEDPREAARLLVQTALMWGSSDNVTCIVVHLREIRRPLLSIMAITPPAVVQDMTWPVLRPRMCEHDLQVDNEMDSLGISLASLQRHSTRPRKISRPLIFDDTLDDNSDAVVDD